MKKTISKSREIRMPIVLCAALTVIALLSVCSINELTGIVRGAAQKLIAINITVLLMTGICAAVVLRQRKLRNRRLEQERENIRKNEQLSRRLQELLIPMNEISEMMYVCDINTYELLFINETGKQSFGMGESIIGMKCYKVLQGMDAPCEFCTNHCLKLGETYSWEHTNTRTKKHYLLKDRLIEWEGRKARLEIAFDITKANEEKIELKRRLERDNTLVTCIRELYRNRDFTQAAGNMLARIGKLFGAERAYIFLLRGDALCSIAEWCRDGGTPQNDYLKQLSMEQYGKWKALLSRQENIIIKDLEEWKDTMPKEYQILAMQDIHNLIGIPIEQNGQLNGFIGLDNLDFDLSESTVLFLQTLQYFITLALQREENEQTLFKLSYMDKLTSFYNRNRYIQDINDLEGETKPVGVIYLDVNGLKEINDDFGHDAGDRLLKNCADIIKRNVTSDRLYRIGGDEFIVITIGTAAKDFWKMVEILKNSFEDRACQVAVGSRWEEHCGDVQETIKQADELMYADKKRFYQSHPATNRYRHSREEV